MELLHNPTFWVATAFVMVVCLAFKKVKVLLLNALDSRSARIKLELEEATRIRKEAEGVLAEYRRRQAEYEKEAAGMLAKAREDAEAFSKQAELELQAAMEQRTRQAMDKIAQEEAKAIKDVQNHVVDISLAAARSILIEHVNNLPQDELVRLVVADIERKVH